VSYQRECLVVGCEGVPKSGSATCEAHNGPWTINPAGMVVDTKQIPYGAVTHEPLLPDRPYYVLPTGVQVKDVVAHLDYNVGVAAAYLFRAGRKPGNAKADDIRKAIDHLNFELERINGKR
jgi:hypothetical protein